MKLCLGLVTALLLCCVATADVLPPQAAALTERFENNPGAFDRYDQWCDGHAVDAACQIPGTAFEGGGLGRCKRIANRAEAQIDLLCVILSEPQIERAMANGLWQADSDLCGSAKTSTSQAQTLKSMGWTCDDQPVVRDRFCKGLTEGQRCMADMRVAGVAQTHEGICRMDVESQSVYYQGRRTVSRVGLLCLPTKTAPATVLKPVSAWKKLIQ